MQVRGLVRLFQTILAVLKARLKLVHIIRYASVISSLISHLAAMAAQVFTTS